MTFSKKGIVQGDEKVDMLMKSEKKSKNRKKNAVTDDSEVTKGDVKAVEHDSCFKEESLSFTGIRKERDKTKMETQAPGESEGSYIKIKKERGGGKQHGKYSKDGCEDTVNNVLKKKKKLKNEQDILIMHDASLDTKTLAHESASGTHETKAVETLSEGSGGNLIDEVKRKKKKKKKDKRGKDGQVDIVVGVIQGVVSADEVNRKKRKKDKKKREDGLVDIVAGVIQFSYR